METQVNEIKLNALDEIQKAYEAMDQRTAIKSLLRISEG